MKKRAHEKLMERMNNVLQQGSVPDLSRKVKKYMIPREELRKSIRNLFIPVMVNNRLRYFGVILGRLGTGKQLS